MKNERGITSFTADADVAEILELAQVKDTGLTRSHLINESVRRHAPHIIREHMSGIRSKAEHTLALLDKLGAATSPPAQDAGAGSRGKGEIAAGPLLQSTVAAIRKSSGKSPRNEPKARG